ncbi:transposase [Streptomyces sp. NPDC088135]|uniref:transposase n=1 Tax=Streptomyces sp. NPDC088135 TaxID=3160993 RepID=UPI00342CA573
MRVNHEYQRGGALAYLAAYDVHRAKVIGRCEPKTGIIPFMNLVTQVMTTEPYASARRVLWIVDNGSSHRGQKAIDRLTTAFPNAVMVHTPVHASWPNQIEIFFSIVQRKVVQPNDFTDLTRVRDRLRAFEDRYNATAQPFQWKFTTTDLDDLLAGSTDTQPPTDKKNPPPPWQPDQPPRTSGADHLVGFDTHELCRRPRSHARPARRSPDRVDDLELTLTEIDTATASQATPGPARLPPVRSSAFHRV